MIIRAAREARKWTISAISSGSTSRAIDCPATYSASTASAVVPRDWASASAMRRMRSPLTEPGQMRLTRTCHGPNSTASDFVSPTRPALDAAYAVRRPTPYRPDVDPMLTMTPSRWRFIAGITRRAVRKWPTRSTSTHRAHSDGSQSSASAMGPAIPAALTSTSTPPQSSITRGRASSSAAGSETSTTRHVMPGASAQEHSACSSGSARATRAPSASRREAIAAPIPEAPPVTITRRAGVLILAGGRRRAGRTVRSGPGAQRPRRWVATPSWRPDERR